MGENEEGTVQPTEPNPADPIETPEKAKTTDGPPDTVPFSRLQEVSREKNELKAANADLVESRQLLDRILSGDADAIAALNRQGIGVGSQPSTAPPNPAEQDPFAENQGLTPEQVQQMINQGLQSVQGPLRQMAADQARASLTQEFAEQYDSTRDDPRLREILTAAPGLSARDAFVLLQSKRSVPADATPPPTKRGSVQAPRSGGRQKDVGIDRKSQDALRQQYADSGSKDPEILAQIIARSWDME